jgi:hypothetical protein
MTRRRVISIVLFLATLAPGASAFAQTRIVTGRLTDSRDGRPAAGLRVRALDDDVNASDLMGEATSDINGNYTIVYAVRDWDTSTFFKPHARHPDIFIAVDVPCGSGAGFGSLGRSGVRGNNTDATLTIDLAVNQTERGNICGPSVCCTPQGLTIWGKHCRGQCAPGGGCACRALRHNWFYGDTACECAAAL